MDVVWLKRDVRLHDHGPLAEVARSNDPFVLLYLYEPDQLREETVHGSHLRFIHEGLLDLEARLKKESKSGLERTRQVENSPDDEATTFEYLTICHNTAVATLTFVHQKHSIRRLLSHEETGHWQSYMRDRAVRKWCRANGVQFVEYNQTGVTRCLRNRDDYNKHWKAFVAKPRHPTPNAAQLRAKIVQLSDLPGFIPVLKTDDASHWNLIFTEIPLSHRDDRRGRQQHGGETKALATLDSFLQERGSRFSQDISSPNTAWNSCSRLSPYLAWGHVSLRLVVHSLQQRQEQLKQMKAQGRNTGTWLRSLQAFSSRLHWRSHFIQKLESEPTLEFRDLCPSYQHLRRQDGDWNEAHYNAWATGTTGFPYVDACMRCLLKHGWINFRMRAMLVSFACYNLWLDWKRIAPHLARVFLDFEPGIHYPQLQMQAGTTGINAMRVYSVTKQG
jgi:deoxyribodipyrimidine photo-lyase